MATIPPSLVTPVWISGVLRNAGMLPTGTVAAVQIEPLAAFNSTVERLTLHYSTDTPAEVPRQLVLKRNADHAGMCEAPFYELVRTLPSRLPMLPRCYGAGYDAAFHAQHVECRTRELAQFLVLAGAQVPADQRALLEQALANLPKLWTRLVASRVDGWHNLTLSNGDCYFAQFLCPLAPDDDQAFLIDYQDASVNFGPYDLVYMFATFWTGEQRHAHNRELRLLRRYHQGLLSHGVRGYDWQTLLRDYRLMVSYMIFDPVWNATGGSGQAYWWPKLQCLVEAYRDLDCANLV